MNYGLVKSIFRLVFLEEKTAINVLFCGISKKKLTHTKVETKTIF